ncbi:MAG: hypothetical protein QOF52_179 [Propionibacteriaceae bacterium]|jgi:hypothetical protein|nr:hypothetical protein [Propionibacteriaceae bacterium]MDX6320321.1 hypothetical protein [Propionibacteriaceae bacterium]
MRFEGEIAGMGTGSGVRIVVGMWRDTPLGSFADVMVQQPDGHRVLLAPSEPVAAFIATTYRFDETRIGPVVVSRRADTRRVTAPGLVLEFRTGRRRWVGWLLRAVPRRLAIWPRWLTVIDPVARLLMRGVRTSGSAGHRRREYYGAWDVHAVVDLRGSWRGTDLGELKPVHPPVTFGFGSTPSAPAVTSIVTTVQ